MSLAESDSSIEDLATPARQGPQHPRPRHPKPAPSPPASPPSKQAEPPKSSGATQASQVWLDGDVLACVCPQCEAPMTIRLWLGLAECRMCGAQLELTEEQERVAQRLWESRAVAPPADAAMWQVPPSKQRPTWSQPTSPPPPKPQPRHPKPALPKQPQAEPSPAAARREPPRLTAVPVIEPPPLPTLLQRTALAEPPAVALRPPARPWLTRYTWQSIVSGLVSMLIHMIVMVVLGLWFIPRPNNGTLVLQAEFRMAGRQEQKAEAVVQVIPKQPTPPPAAPLVEKQELRPASLPEPPKVKDQVAALVQAPELPAANQFAAGVVRPGTMFAGRDPRLRADIVRSEGGSDQSERAVALGLKWLAAHQDPQGGWSLDRFHEAGDCNGQCKNDGQRSDVAATALGLLPFLGAGYTHQSGPHREMMQRALDRLIEWQRVDGSFQRLDRGRMYAHGLATIALCEAYALTKDRKLLVPAQTAVQFIVLAQHRRGGGWRYTPGMEGDMSVVGWQLMALRSAQSCYFEVPKQTLDAASRFLDSVQTHREIATFGYMPGYEATPAMTAEGILSRLYGGTPADDAALLRGADYLLDENPPTRRDVNLYYWYYATQAMHHLGGPRWIRWNNQMRELLIGLQIRDGHAAGSWNPGKHHDPAGGRLYATALAVCTLEVYYRHLPLYRVNPPALPK